MDFSQKKFIDIRFCSQRVIKIEKNVKFTKKPAEVFFFFFPQTIFMIRFEIHKKTLKTH